MRKSNIGQLQRTISVLFLDGSKKNAVATGNNAAWVCSCPNPLPLIGRSGKYNSITNGYVVLCPCCERSYYVLPEGKDYGRASKVKEIQI
jgi:hypothetical protein